MRLRYLDTLGRGVGRDDGKLVMARRRWNQATLRLEVRDGLHAAAAHFSRQVAVDTLGVGDKLLPLLRDCGHPLMRGTRPIGRPRSQHRGFSLFIPLAFYRRADIVLWGMSRRFNQLEG
jgi:hypothetical protein